MLSYPTSTLHPIFAVLYHKDNIKPVLLTQKNGTQQTHTCLTAAENCCGGTAALDDGGDGGSDEHTPNVVINTPTYAGHANTFNYKHNVHVYCWWCIDTTLTWSKYCALNHPMYTCSMLMSTPADKLWSHQAALSCTICIVTST